MSEKNFNARDLEKVKTVDTLLEVCTNYESYLPLVPKFNEKYQALKLKRDEVGIQSVQKNQAKASSSSIITDVDAEKLAIINYVCEDVSLFVQYADEEKDSTLQSILPNLMSTKLKAQKPLDMVTTLQSFVTSALKMSLIKAVAYGIEDDWVSILSDKVTNYNNMLPKHATTKKNKPKTTVGLKTSIAEMMVIKNQLDKLIPAFKKKQPELFSTYKDLKTVAAVTSKTGNKANKNGKNKVVTTTETPKTVQE